MHDWKLPVDNFVKVLTDITIHYIVLQSYQQICEKYPSFRERSENVDLVVEISLQPWKVFRPDGVSCLPLNS